MEKYEIIKFTDNELEIDVNVSPEEDTVWLTKEQMSVLFQRDRSVISRHIKNILNEELQEKSNVHFLHIANSDKPVPFYNLDVVISVGYRVKSKRGVMFRKWAINVLKQFLLKGYSLNGDRILISKDNYLQLENDVAMLKEEVTDIKEKVFIEPIKQKVFFNGEFFDSYELIISLTKKAKNKIVIIDPYFDDVGLNFLTKVSDEVIKMVCLSHKGKLSDYDIAQFEKQYGKIEVTIRDSFHDRFLIIDDNECYLLGISLNYLGDKTFGINKIEDENVIQGILKRIKD